MAWIRFHIRISIFNRFDTIHERDRQTTSPTPHDIKSRAVQPRQAAVAREKSLRYALYVYLQQRHRYTIRPLVNRIEPVDIGVLSAAFNAMS